MITKTKKENILPYCKKTKKIPDKKGFIMGLLLIGTPLFLTILMTLTALIFCIRNYELHQSSCIKHTLRAQEKMQVSLEKLLRLNPLANRLRKIQKILEKLYYKALKTGEPITISTLKTKIELIKQKRKILDKKQKLILNLTIKDLNIAFYSFKQKIAVFQPGYVKKTHHRPIPLAVKASPMGDIAPAYIPKINFASKQTISFLWKTPIHRFLPKWIEHILFQSKMSSYRCSATIHKKTGKWKTTLTASILNLHFFDSYKIKNPPLAYNFLIKKPLFLTALEIL